MISSRVAGWPLVVGAALLFLAEIGQTFLFAGNNPLQYAQQPLFVATNLVLTLGAILAIWGLPLLYASPRARGLGWMGGVGAFLVMAAGAGLGIFMSLMSAILLPYLATHAPNIFNDNTGPAELFVFFIVATAVQIVGCVFLAIPLVRGLAFSRWPGYVLLASAALAIVGFAVGGGSSNLLLSLLSNLNAFALFVALGWLGWQMITRPSQTEVIAGAE